MTNVEEIRKKADALRKLLRRVDRITDSGERENNERKRDAERKRSVRQGARDLQIPCVANYKRRASCKRDLFRFLRTYFPSRFSGDWTAQRRQMAEAILNAAKYGGDQAIAAPRGEGKTAITEGVVIYCVLLGLVRFPIIAAATGEDARRILANIKAAFERNELLGADFPRVCYPIQSLQGAPQRAGMQTVNGCRTHLKWATDHIVLPTVARSEASGAIIMTRGLDAAIRGIRVGSLRPDLVIVDDPETRESVMSETQTRTRELTIEQDLAGLGGPDKRLARVMLTTLMRRSCLSAKYTDRKQRSSWKGRRFRMIEKWPDRGDLWDDYMAQREANQQADDEHARGAHAFYLEHREAMDRGAVVTNPTRYVADRLPDGSQLEISAIQHAYNVIADRGREHFDCEYQNDPPEETGPIESGITAHRVQTQCSGYPRKLIPPGCTVLTHAIDCRKVALHWVVRAWRPDATGYTIDYGVEEVHGTVVGSDEGVDVAIARAIQARMEALRQSPYATLDGATVSIDQTLVDAGWRTEAVYHACRELKQAGFPIWPAMGFGKSNGAVRTNFNAPVRTTVDKKAGDGWFLSRRPKGIWLCCMDADRWKAWEHDRWMTPTDKPGSLLMWGARSDKPDRLSQDEKAHHSYARHIVSEIEVEEVVKGALKRFWKAKSDNNHWLDASYMTDVAANMMGISLLGGRAPAPPQQGQSWFGRQS